LQSKQTERGQLGSHRSSKHLPPLFELQRGHLSIAPHHPQVSFLTPVGSPIDCTAPPTPRPDPSGVAYR